MMAAACRCCSAEGRAPGRFACVLLPIVHLLQELLGFLLVDKGQAGETVFELEGMEEDPILIVIPGFIDLLVPDDASIRRLQTCQVQGVQGLSAALAMRLDLPRYPPS